MEKTISPGLKVTFLAGSFAAGIFGLIYVLVPEAFQIFIGVPIKQPTETTAFREFGVAFLAVAYCSWLAYKATVVDEVKIAVKMVIVWMLLGALVMLWCLLSSELPAIYWLYFVLFAGFATANIIFYPRG
jgi:hypothetical protein